MHKISFGEQLEAILYLAFSFNLDSEKDRKRLHELNKKADDIVNQLLDMGFESSKIQEGILSTKSVQVDTLLKYLTLGSSSSYLGNDILRIVIDHLNIISKED